MDATFHTKKTWAITREGQPISLKVSRRALKYALVGIYKAFNVSFLKREVVLRGFGLPTGMSRAMATCTKLKRFGYLGHSLPCGVLKKVTAIYQSK